MWRLKRRSGSRDSGFSNSRYIKLTADVDDVGCVSGWDFNGNEGWTWFYDEKLDLSYFPLEKVNALYILYSFFRYDTSLVSRLNFSTFLHIPKT